MNCPLCRLAPFLAASPLLATDLFVGPAGHDANPGTRAEPLATLVAARDRVRTPGGGKHTITLCTGTYMRATTFALDARDSGLTLRGETGARLLGGQVVTGWAPSGDPRRCPRHRLGQLLV